MIRAIQFSLIFTLTRAAELSRPGEIPDLYTVAGQQDWNGECQTSLKQSPIDIEENSNSNDGWISWEYDTFGNSWTVEAHNWLKNLSGDSGLKMKLADIGPSSHAIKYTPEIEPEFCYLNICVKLAQFHFHILNSEHAWNNNLAFAEVHYVTYRSDMFGDLMEAVVDGKPGNLRVFGYFIEPAVSNKHDMRADKHFQDFYDVIDNRPIDEIDDSSFVNVVLIVPSNISNGFARYDGGLTTPTCNEIVTWTVFKQPIYISNQMAERLAGLPMNLQHNNRFVQPINGRKIKLFRDPDFTDLQKESFKKFQLFHYFDEENEDENPSQRIGQIKTEGSLCLESAKKSINLGVCNEANQQQSFHLSTNGLQVVQGFGGNRKCFEYTDFPSENQDYKNLEYLITLRKCSSSTKNKDSKNDNYKFWTQAFTFDQEKGMLMAFNDNRWCAGFNKNRMFVLRPCITLFGRQAGVFGEK